MKQRKVGALFMLSDLPQMRPNTALQTGQDKLSRLLHSQKPLQLAIAAELGR
jgi:hypothetical protein